MSGTDFECEYCANDPSDGPPCELVADDVRQLEPCGSPCAALAEAACIAALGCRATYVDGQFDHCWGSERRTGARLACVNLEVHACAQQDSCAAMYTTTTGGVQFDHCGNEPPVSASR